MPKTLGQLGESMAVNYLKKHKYSIVETNFRTRFGEIDIIAQEGDILVFVEVKTRSGKDFGLPQEAVGFKKQNKMVRMALKYVSDHQYKDTWRIDVVAILFEKKEFKNIELIRNAVTEF